MGYIIPDFAANLSVKEPADGAFNRASQIGVWIPRERSSWRANRGANLLYPVGPAGVDPVA
jgi:hypothetical protein